MPDEVRAAAAWASKVEPEIVRARVTARGAIMALQYEAAANELTGYETALKETLSDVEPAPSVVEVRYYQEFQREVGGAVKKYGGGVATREATALARCWEGRGLDYQTMQAIAYDLFGLTLPDVTTYQHGSIRREEHYDPPSVDWTANMSILRAREEWSETYGVETHELAWFRAKVGPAHVGLGREFWLRWTPSVVTIDWPAFDACTFRILTTPNHHAGGLESTEACYLSLLPEQTHVNFDIGDLEEGTPRVEHFEGVEIPADAVIEAALSTDDDWEPDYNEKNQIEIAGTWEILWTEP